MEGAIDNIKMLFKKQKEEKQTIKKWFKKQWKKVKESRTFLAILILAIGNSYTISYYEFQDLWKDYQSALKTFEKFNVGTMDIPAVHAYYQKNTQNREEKIETVETVSAHSTLQGIFTAYNAEPEQTDSNPDIMASGKKVYEGAIANNCLPFGTKIEVNGKVKIVEDRMNSRYGCDHFDIYMESYDDAIKFGKQELTFKKLER